MGLKERAQKFADTRTNDPLHGVITDATEFANGIHASVDGQPVRVIMTGNVTGFSPGYLCVDAEGVSAWVSLSDTRITDPNYLPMKQTNQGKNQ